MHGCASAVYVFLDGRLELALNDVTDRFVGVFSKPCLLPFLV